MQINFTDGSYKVTSDELKLIKSKNITYLSALLECSDSQSTEITIPRSGKLFRFVLDCYSKHPIKVLAEYKTNGKDKTDCKILIEEMNYYMMFDNRPVDLKVISRIEDPATAYKKWLVDREIHFDILNLIGGSLVGFAALEILHSCDYSAAHDNVYYYLTDKGRIPRDEKDKEIEITVEQYKQLGFTYMLDTVRKYSAQFPSALECRICNRKRIIKVVDKKITIIYNDYEVLVRGEKNFVFKPLSLKNNINKFDLPILNTQVSESKVVFSSDSQKNELIRKSLRVPLAMLEESSILTSYFKWLDIGFSLVV